MNEANKLLIKTDPLRLALSLTVSCGVVAACVWLVFGTGWIFTVACVLLVAFCGVGLVNAVVTGKPAVEIDDRGITARHAFGERSYTWADVDGEFAVQRRFVMSMVVFRLTPDAEARIGKLRAAPFPGYDAGITGSYPITLPELAAMLNRRLAASRGVPGSETPIDAPVTSTT